MPSSFTTYALLVLVSLSWGNELQTIGYLPEYRHGYDAERAVQGGKLTDVVLFSIEISAQGGIQGDERLPSRARVEQLRTGGAKVHLCVGGAGRSSEFPKLLDVQVRKKTVSAVIMIVRQWQFDGVDVDWEAPRDEAQWRILGNFLADLRKKWDKIKERHVQALHLSFTMWPHDVRNMIAAKAGHKTLVDIVDRVHLMTYSGEEETAVNEWEKQKLPLRRLAIGIRFFLGGGTPYYELAKHERESTRGNDERQRVTMSSSFARKKRLAGVFLWEIGQDLAPSDNQSLLHAVYVARSAAAKDEEL